MKKIVYYKHQILNDMKHNFSSRVRKIMTFSREEAGRLQNNFLAPEHLMLGILRNGEGVAIDSLSELGVDIKVLKNKLDTSLEEKKETSQPSEVMLDEKTEKILK